jgi:hypothetical protein
MTLDLQVGIHRTGILCPRACLSSKSNPDQHVIVLQTMSNVVLPGPRPGLDSEAILSRSMHRYVPRPSLPGSDGVALNLKFAPGALIAFIVMWAQSRFCQTPCF